MHLSYASHNNVGEMFTSATSTGTQPNTNHLGRHYAVIPIGADSV